MSPAEKAEQNVLAIGDDSRAAEDLLELVVMDPRATDDHRAHHERFVSGRTRRGLPRS